MSGNGARALILGLERVLIAIGVGCLIWAGQASLRSAVYQSVQLNRVHDAGGDLAGSSAPAIVRGGLVGRLEVPRLRLAAAVAEGEDQATLDVAVGHLRDTPLPWENGNSALAAHRDTFFRPLRHIRTGDDVRVTAPHGRWDFRVTKAMIVDPGDVWVLEPTSTPTLTLITCYPFGFVGPAPKRFVVQAERVAAYTP
jgi:sortase A